MTNAYEFLKQYISLLALLGMGGAQLWNLYPSDQSLLAFAGFTILESVIVVNALGIIRGTRLTRRGAEFVREPAHSGRTRRVALTALALTPPFYLAMTLFYHVPNSWPIITQAGAEPRPTNLWLHAIGARSLIALDDPFVAPLFFPGSEFTPSEMIYYVMVGNRSTVASPPLALRLVLHPASGSSQPPAQPYLMAVAVPAAHPWRPLGDLIAFVPMLSRWLPAGGMWGGRTRPEWLTYRGQCQSGLLGGAWCFTGFPTFPATWSTWREPEIRLPAIPPRGSLEIYIELAFRQASSGRSVPITVVLSQAGEGGFAVHIRRDVDLPARTYPR